MNTAWVMCCSIDDSIVISLWDTEQKAKEDLLNELIKVTGREDSGEPLEDIDDQIIYFANIIDNSWSVIYSIKEQEIK